MEKIFLLLTISVVLFFTNVRCISIREHIQRKGMPAIANGVLFLSGKNLTSLEGLEDIPNLNLVTELYLFNNQLQTLPANIFNNLVQLQDLFLHNNQLKSLPDNIFDNLALLQRLNLSYNQLQSLPNNIFANLTQLQDIYLNDNQLQSLADNTFDNLALLEGLYLHNNQLQSLPNNIFDNLTQLQNLYLNGNQIQLLPHDILNNLTALKYFNLYNNQLQGTTEEFRQICLQDKSDIRLNFKNETQEHNEAIEQKYFHLVASLPDDAKQGKVNLIKILKDLGDTSYLGIVLSRDSHGNTLLHKSVLLCNPLLVKLIAQLWPEMVGAKNSLGRTPLHTAATIKNRTVALSIFKELLAASSDPEKLFRAKDDAGDTSLRIAIENIQLSIVQHLLAFEDNQNTGKLGKSRKLNVLLQQPDLVKAFEILARIRERTRLQELQ